MDHTARYRQHVVADAALKSRDPAKESHFFQKGKRPKI